MARLTIAADEAQLAATAADRIASRIRDACGTRGAAFVCLTGGRTPERTYEELAVPARSRGVDWARVHLFWGDERHVPPDHPDSNYGMAKRALLDRISIPFSNVHRVLAEMSDAREAAADYDRTLDGLAVASTTRRQRYFDLMLLGLGEDAHIASIFPGSDLLARPGNPRRVAAVRASHLNAWRITLTPDTILDSDAVVMLVAGAAKADAVRAAFESPSDVATCPVHLLRAAGDRVEWLIDRAAAGRLSA